MKRTVPFSSIPDRPHRIILLQIFIHLSDKIDFVYRNVLSGIIQQLQTTTKIPYKYSTWKCFSLIILHVSVDCLFSSAHLPRLLDRVRKQKRESSRGLGWHGPCCPQWRPLNPHRLHPPPQQRLLLFPHLLQDLLPYCTIWGLARPSSSPSPLVFGWTWRLQLCQVQWKKRLFVLVKIFYD